MESVKPYKCSICGHAFDDSSNAKRHVGARRGACFKRDAVVLRRHVEIRASDRVVGGRERVEDYASGRPFPPVEDHGPNGDDEPNVDAEPAGDDELDEPCVHPDPKELQSNDMRGLIEKLRSAVSGDDIVQEFKISADPTTSSTAAAAQIQEDSRTADGMPELILNYSQRKILKLRKDYKLNLKATNAVMSLVQDPQFNPSEIGTERVQTLESALLRGHDGEGVKEYDFHSDGDGLQDLKLYLLDCKQVASEMFGDPKFKGHFTFKFTPTCDDEGRRTFGSAMGGVWAQFHARAVVDGVEVILVLAIYIDASYVKINLTVKPIYCK